MEKKIISSINRHKRNSQFELLTIIAMTLVIAGHCEVTYDYRETWIFRWIYSFHMPLFFFISGFLFSLTNRKDRLAKTTYWKFMKGKTIRLLLPFIFIDLIAIGFKLALSNHKEYMINPVEPSWYGIYYNIFIMPTGYLWFLMALFLIFALIYPIYKLLILNCKVKTVNYVLLSISIVTLITAYYLFDIKQPSFFQYQRAYMHLPWFILGMLYMLNKEWLDRLFIYGYQITLPLAFCISFLLVLPRPWSCVLGIYMWLIFSLKTYKLFPSKFLDLSTMTYGIYLLSYFPILFDHNFIYPRFSNYPEWIFNILSFVMGITLPACVIILYRKIQHKHPLFERMAYLIGIG